MRGDVVRWDDVRGYGFVKRDDGGPDIFVHQTHLLMDGHRTLEVGQRVEFEEKSGKRLEAVQVRVLAVPTHSLDRPSASLTPRASSTSLIWILACKGPVTKIQSPRSLTASAKKSMPLYARP